METGLFIVGFLYIGISIWAIANLFIRYRPRRRG